jgi:DNA-binding MarR family transcriptional regulator
VADSEGRSVKPISEEIKQSHFESDHQRAVLNLLFTYGWLKEQLALWLKPYGLTAQQFNVLRILRGQHPEAVTTWEIRDRMLDKMSDTSRLVDRLAKMQVVDKCTNSGDRRLVDVRINDRGLELLARIDVDQNAPFDRMKGAITDEQAQVLSDLLDRLRAC